ncbi:metalloendoproteinase 1-like [Lotus japonicus]|uniref:metalloendoproteinase 1-like n=1 Tax=Lotus japonicus TaxID=34305 RepID=UPI002585AD9D|nr:metalloendoproteinase 1-like [Lotus japonicus]
MNIYIPSSSILVSPTHHSASSNPQPNMTLHHHHGLFFVALAILYFFTISFPTISARSFPTPSISHMHKHKSWEGFHNFTNSRPGQTHKDLSTVKNYFHRFGYIPNAPPTNFTDVFDETLVYAIQTYQKNYHLNVTGELDNNTVKHMTHPRCGVPDIIHTKMRNSTTVHFHMGSLYSFFEGYPRWPEGTNQLTYAFLPENQLHDDYKSAIASAFNQWTPVVKIAFEETSSYEMANIKVAFFQGYHGDDSPFDGPMGELAHSFAPTDGRFHLDADEYWMASGDVTTSPVERAMDLETVAVHEIGHLLGLGHSSDQNAIMYPLISSRVKKVDLTSDDIEGIRELYGIN